MSAATNVLYTEILCNSNLFFFFYLKTKTVICIEKILCSKILSKIGKKISFLNDLDNYYINVM